jgi:hypothetical protein
MAIFRDVIEVWKNWVSTWVPLEVDQEVRKKGFVLAQRVEDLFKEEYKLSFISEADEDMELLPRAQAAFDELLKFIDENSPN